MDRLAVEGNAFTRRSSETPDGRDGKIAMVAKIAMSISDERKALAVACRVWRDTTIS